MQNKIISLVGNDECILSYVSHALIQEGHSVRILSTISRDLKQIKLHAELGQIFIQTINESDYNGLCRALRGSYAVINLSGAGVSSWNHASVRNELLLAKATEELKIKHLIHFSYLSAGDVDSSNCAHSQYTKEKTSLRECRNAITVRSSVIFGEHDHFISLIKQYLSFSTIVPLLNQHTELLAPIYAGDVAKAIILILRAPEKFHGQVLEFKGTQDYSMQKVIKAVSDVLKKEVTFIHIPRGIMRILVMISRIFPPLAMIRMQTELFAHSRDDRQNRLTENKQFRITQHGLKNFLQH